MFLNKLYYNKTAAKETLQQIRLPYPGLQPQFIFNVHSGKTLFAPMIWYGCKCSHQYLKYYF